MSGDLLDLVLIALAAAFAVAGYRQGFIIGVLSFAGFIGGTVLGILVAPSFAMLVTKRQSLQAVLAIVVVFAAAVIGMLITSAIGVALRARVRRRQSTVLDSLGGAVVNVVAILLLAWLIGSLVAYAPPFPGIAYQVNNSVLLRTVDRLIPQSARPEFSALRRLLSTQPYVQVFGALGAETALNVPKPDEAVLHSPGLVRDANSIVKVEGLAPSCSRRIEGSGLRDRAMTGWSRTLTWSPGSPTGLRFSRGRARRSRRGSCCLIRSATWPCCMCPGSTCPGFRSWRRRRSARRRSWPGIRSIIRLRRCRPGSAGPSWPTGPISMTGPG